MCLLQLVLLVAPLAVIGDSSTNNPPMVKTRFGPIAGKWTVDANDLPVANYLGIPYAEPPVGDLRFRSPKPWTRSWTGVLNATKDGTPCIQILRSGDIVGDEDCLYLNVFVPKFIDKRYATFKRPVLVFVHGGSFNTGHASSQFYSPVYWSVQEVILVVMNYRLGPLGFFSLASKSAPGNYGLKDMQQALKWVQENIERFGGDPNVVTLMGQSAGAAAAHILALSEKTDGLFTKYILHSGSALSAWAVHPTKSIEHSSLSLARNLDCSSYIRNLTNNVGNLNDSTTTIDYFSSEEGSEEFDEQIVECMRDVDPSSILNRVSDLQSWKQNPYCIFGPTLEDDSIEDAILSIPPMVIIKKHLFRDMPCIIGVVQDEGLLKTRELYDDQEMQKLLIDNFHTILPSVLESQEIITNVSEFTRAIEDFYFEGNVTINLMNNITELAGDGLITWPTYMTVKYLSEVTKSGLYFFKFCYQTVSNGIAHGDELYYLFHTWNYNYSQIPLENTIDDWTMIDIMTEMWANFMRTGVPSAWRTAEWPDYRDHHEFMRFGAGTMPNIGLESDFLSDRMEFWERLVGNVTDETSNLNLMMKPEEEGGSVVSRAYNWRVASSFLCLVTIFGTSIASSLL